MSEYERTSPYVDDFVRRHGLEDAVALAEQTLKELHARPLDVNLSTHVFHDPEGGSETLVFAYTVKGKSYSDILPLWSEVSIDYAKRLGDLKKSKLINVSFDVD